MTEIKLGDKVRDKITGFIGTAVAKTEFLNGCIQFNVLPKLDKGNKMPDEIGIDEQSLEIIKPKTKKKPKRENGGSMRKGFKQRGF